MRETPKWFQDELTRIGGKNPYGEPIFKLVWSTTQRTVVGGRWERTGYTGYKQVPLLPGHPCWALMVWEARELSGSAEMWEYDTRDEETGLLQVGGYPKYGYYRLLRKFFHQEIVSRSE